MPKRPSRRSAPREWRHDRGAQARGRQSTAITASVDEDADPFFDPAADKIYRHPTFYVLPDDVGHM